MLKILRKIQELEAKVVILEQKVTEQETLLKAVKEVSGTKRQNDDIKKKQKWLNSYPDETESIGG